MNAKTTVANIDTPMQQEDFICPHCGKKTPAEEVGRWWTRLISGCRSKSKKKALCKPREREKGWKTAKA